MINYYYYYYIDEVCAKFPHLEVLDVSEARITSAGAYKLAACRNLKSLNLFYTSAAPSPRLSYSD